MKKLLLLFCLIPHLTLSAYSGMNTGAIGETIGHVENFDGTVVHIIGDALTNHGSEDVLVNTSTAPIYDLLTGFRTDPQNIYEGMCIRAAYTLSQEPHNAIAVWLNWDYDNSAVFSVTVSGNIQHNNDSTAFLSDDGKYRITVSNETTIICPNSGFITPMDISQGQEYFVWVDMITASSPAIVYPEKLVLLD